MQERTSRKGWSTLLWSVCGAVATAIFAALMAATVKEFDGKEGHLTVAEQQDFSLVQGLWASYTWTIVEPGKTFIAPVESQGYALNIQEFPVEAVFHVRGLDGEPPAVLNQKSEDEKAASKEAQLTRVDKVKGFFRRFGSDEKDEERADKIGNALATLQEKGTKLTEQSKAAGAAAYKNYEVRVRVTYSLEDEFVQQQIADYVAENGGAELERALLGPISQIMKPVRVAKMFADIAKNNGASYVIEGAQTGHPDFEVLSVTELPEVESTKIVSVSSNKTLIEPAEYTMAFYLHLFLQQLPTMILIALGMLAWSRVHPQSYDVCTFFVG